MARVTLTILFVLITGIYGSITFAKDKPNVVLIFMDNFGWGELGSYGGGVLRGAPTPNLDQLADEGMRLLNFNVEAQCTPSRAAIMTGRYALRTGNGSVPLSTTVYGLTQWEYTMAEMFSDNGYATGMFGKWHLGHTKGRFPTDQGFDEWYGIPNTTDESYWPQDSRFREGVNEYVAYAHIMESKRGHKPKKVRLYDEEARREIDGESIQKSMDFMTRQVKKGKSFFLFVPMTQTHLPVLPSKEFNGKTGNGDFADVLAQIDAYSGRLMSKVEELGIAENTIFIFTSDNGPDPTPGQEGHAGMWRGSYFTAYEGSLRVPFIVRWPSKIPAGAVSNEIVHQMDLMPTFANIIGAKLPTDRIIDGVDQLDFLMGKQEKSNREHVMIYVGEELFGVKWRNYKLMMKEINSAFGSPVKEYPVPLMFDLYQDPKEENPIGPHWAKMGWMRYPIIDYMLKHMASLQEEPPIKPGTPDPYTPKR